MARVLSAGGLRMAMTAAMCWCDAATAAATRCRASSRSWVDGKGKAATEEPGGGVRPTASSLSCATAPRRRRLIGWSLEDKLESDAVPGPKPGSASSTPEANGKVNGRGVWRTDGAGLESPFSADQSGGSPKDDVLPTSVDGMAPSDDSWVVTARTQPGSFEAAGATPVRRSAACAALPQSATDAIGRLLSALAELAHCAPSAAGSVLKDEPPLTPLALPPPGAARPPTRLVFVGVTAGAMRTAAGPRGGHRCPNLSRTCVDRPDGPPVLTLCFFNTAPGLSSSSSVDAGGSLGASSGGGGGAASRVP